MVRSIDDGDDNADDEPTLPPEPQEDVAYAVPLCEIMVNGSVAAKYEDSVDSENPPRAVYYDPGDSLPLGLASTIYGSARGGGHGDSIALFDDSGNRVDTKGRAEAAGDLDASDALESWRAEHGFARELVQRYKCQECGETFESESSLAGHQQVHRPVDDADADDVNEGDDGGETMADRLDDDGDDDADGEDDTRTMADGGYEGEAVTGDRRHDGDDDGGEGGLAPEEYPERLEELDPADLPGDEVGR